MSGGSSVPSGDAKLNAASPPNFNIEVAAATTARSTFLKPALFQAGDGLAQHAVAKVALSHVEQF
jgi:hypothetical protein